MHQESYVPITFLTTTVPGKSTPNRKHQLVHVLEKDRWIVRLVVFGQRQLISMPMITMTTSNSSKVNPATRVANWKREVTSDDYVFFPSHKPHSYIGEKSQCCRGV